MADPVTTLAIVNGSLGIALKIGKVINGLRELAQKLKHSEIEILSTAGECETMQVAWTGIARWAQSQDGGTTVDQDLLDRLDQSLVLGVMVMTPFDNDLSALRSDLAPTGFLRRSKIVWNQTLFAQHQQRVRAQVGAMTLLLQVINLPTSQDRTELLAREYETLKASDESAWTIVNSRASLSSLRSESLMSVKSADVANMRLEFEDDLYTSRVYKRSYRSMAMQRLFKEVGKPKDLISPKAQIAPCSSRNPRQEHGRITARKPKSSTMRLYRLVVLGDGDTGKTQFTIQFALNHYVTTYDPTMKDSYRKQCNVDGVDCVVEILDTAGQEEYSAWRDQCIRDGEGFLLIYSITSRSSFSRIHGFHNQIMRIKDNNLTGPALVLVGNNAEDEGERVVSTKEGAALARELDCGFFESSTKNDVNVTSVFHELVRKLRKDWETA